jgi:hypothetical protein
MADVEHGDALVLQGVHHGEQLLELGARQHG